MSQPKYTNRITADNLVVWLVNSGLDDAILQILVKEVKKYPPSALQHYYDNIHSHILKAQNEVKKNNSTDSIKE